jgi:toxin ParE1/3/4
LVAWSIVRTRRARADLLELWLRIAAEDPRAADKALRAIETTIGQLADFPAMGRARDEVRKGLRSIVVGTQLTFYQLLVRVVDGRREFSALFKQ